MIYHGQNCHAGKPLATLAPLAFLSFCPSGQNDIAPGLSMILSSQTKSSEPDAAGSFFMISPILRKSFPQLQKLTAGNGAGRHEKGRPYMIYHAAEKNGRKSPQTKTASNFGFPAYFYLIFPTPLNKGL